LGAPPLVAFQGPQKLRADSDELGVAGALAGEPIRVVRGKTVDLLVPADAEIIIEGTVDPEYLDPKDRSENRTVMSRWRTIISSST
jgi:4-hydroxy-3-polyprenylbenzoate decarboxylase